MKRRHGEPTKEPLPELQAGPVLGNGLVKLPLRCIQAGGPTAGAYGAPPVGQEVRRPALPSQLEILCVDALGRFCACVAAEACSGSSKHALQLEDEASQSHTDPPIHPSAQQIKSLERGIIAGIKRTSLARPRLPTTPTHACRRPRPTPATGKAPPGQTWYSSACRVMVFRSMVSSADQVFWELSGTISTNAASGCFLRISRCGQEQQQRARATPTLP
jgi:hypothetical protein